MATPGGAIRDRYQAVDKPEIPPPMTAICVRGAMTGFSVQKAFVCLFLLFCSLFLFLLLRVDGLGNEVLFSHTFACMDTGVLGNSLIGSP